MIVFPEYFYRLAPTNFTDNIYFATTDSSGVICFNLLSQETKIEPTPEQQVAVGSEQLIINEQ